MCNHLNWTGFQSTHRHGFVDVSKINSFYFYEMFMKNVINVVRKINRVKRHESWNYESHSKNISSHCSVQRKWSLRKWSHSMTSYFFSLWPELTNFIQKKSCLFLFCQTIIYYTQSPHNEVSANTISTNAISNYINWFWLMYVLGEFRI